MRKLLYILFLFPLVGFSQWETGLLVSRMQAGPTNLYTLANAANPDNEVDATTGASGVTNWTVTSVSSPTAQNGTYALLWTHSGPDNTSYIGLITLSGLTIGNTYKIGLWANKLHSATTYGYNEVYVYTDDWDSIHVFVSTGPETVSDTWSYYEITAVPNKTNPTIRVSSSSNADAGNEVMIDNISIEDVTP